MRALRGPRGVLVRASREFQRGPRKALMEFWELSQRTVPWLSPRFSPSFPAFPLSRGPLAVKTWTKRDGSRGRRGGDAGETRVKGAPGAVVFRAELVTIRPPPRERPRAARAGASSAPVTGTCHIRPACPETTPRLLLPEERSRRGHSSNRTRRSCLRPGGRSVGGRGHPPSPGPGAVVIAAHDGS